MNKKILSILSLSFLVFSCAPSSESVSSPTFEEPTTNVSISSPTTSVEETRNNSSTSFNSEGEKFTLSDRYVVTYYEVDTCYENFEDPYINVDEEEFYSNYVVSTSFIDSYYRSLHGLLSGELINEDGSWITNSESPKQNEDTYYKNAIVRYGKDESGEVVSYTINTLDNNDYIIYKCGIYTSLNDVCAYLFAFNDLPVNYISGTSLKDEVYERYNELGRLNFNKYTGPSANKYQYEPYLIGQKDKSLFYREVDFGANIGDDHYFTYSSRYNSSNGRGPFRIVLSNSYDNSYTYSKKSEEYITPNPTSIDDRYVYYTNNHYNDFSEYLNYYNGFATPFGNVSAGNIEDKYIASNPPTEQTPSVLAIFN